MKKTVFIAVLFFCLAAFFNGPALAQSNGAPAADPAASKTSVDPAASVNPAAPAAEPPGADKAWMSYKNPYAGEQNDIGNAHRTNDEITAWAARAVADTLSFGAGEFDDRVKGFKDYFIQDGWAGYVAYLTDSKLLGVARSGKYAVATASDGDPMILNSGRIGAAYHWQVEVPVITSVTQPDGSGETRTVSTTRSKVQVLLARTAQGGGADGIVIESWKVPVPPEAGK